MFQVLRHLTIRRKVSSLSKIAGIPERTLHRWIKYRLAELIEEERGFYSLKGYVGGQPVPKVLIPAGPEMQPDKYCKFYLRLGWTIAGFDKVSNSYIMIPEDVPVESDDDEIPSEFRAYRHLVLKTGSTFQFMSEEQCDKYFRNACKACPREPHHAPMIEKLCQQCKRTGVYRLAKQKLQALRMQPEPIHVLTFLSYEFRKELMLIMEHALREAHEKDDFTRFDNLRQSLGTRYYAMREVLIAAKTYDTSIENKLGKSIFGLVVTASSKQAEKAIRKSLDCSRWRQMDEVRGGQENVLIPLKQRAEREYEAEVRSVVDQALFAKL
jgi:hypothetical protein